MPFDRIGTMIVNNKMSFFSDALGHSALTGIALGTVVGVSNYSLSMIIFAVCFALLLNYIKNKKTAKSSAVTAYDFGCFFCLNFAAFYYVGQGSILNMKINLVI